MHASYKSQILILKYLCRNSQVWFLKSPGKSRFYQLTYGSYSSQYTTPPNFVMQSRPTWVLQVYEEQGQKESSQKICDARLTNNSGLETKVDTLV